MLYNPDKKSRKHIYSLLVIYWLFLVAATSIPASKLPDIEDADKYEHFVAYTILTILVSAALLVQNKSRYLKNSAFFLSVLFVSFYGLLDELHQMIIPGRNCSFLDWIADFSGALTGSLICFIIYRYEKNKRKRVNGGNYLQKSELKDKE